MPFRHLLIFLPGIMGSALERRVSANKLEPIWTLSGVPLWQHLQFVRGALSGKLDALALDDTDWMHDLDDGFVATRILPDLYSIPRLVEQAGYGPMLTKLASDLGVTTGSIHAPTKEANFYPFPYDWRRDNRASARKLAAFIDQQLPKWREHSGAKDAQVILVGHSMGGLVARYYVEVLGGWKNTRALVTIGTPHRGSLNALDNICNGMTMAFADLSAVVRQLRSAAQLLPTYPCVSTSGSTQRAAELDGLPFLEKQRSATARNDFHEAIFNQAKANRALAEYQTVTIPWIGTRQDTLQSAEFKNGKVTVSYAPPAGVPNELGDGDGTVPRISALPADMQGMNMERFGVERHGWLTNHATVTQPLIQTLQQIGASTASLGALHGDAEAKRPAVNLRLEPLFVDETPHIQISLVNAQSKDYMLNLRIRPTGKPAQPARKVTVKGDQPLVVDLGQFEANLYQIEIAPASASPTNPERVHGVFEVVTASQIP